MNTYTVTATDGTKTIQAPINAQSHVDAARTALNDPLAFAGFDETANLTITVSLP